MNVPPRIFPTIETFPSPIDDADLTCSVPADADPHAWRVGAVVAIFCILLTLATVAR